MCRLLYGVWWQKKDHNSYDMVSDRGVLSVIVWFLSEFLYWGCPRYDVCISMLHSRYGGLEMVAGMVVEGAIPGIMHRV